MLSGRQLDLREQRPGPALGHQTWPGAAIGLHREALGIHQTHSLAERVQAESLPRQVQKRESGDDGDLHPGVRPQEFHCSLGYQRRARDGVHDGHRRVTARPR